MADTFRATKISGKDGIDTVEIGFGAPAANSEIVPDAIAALRGLGVEWRAAFTFMVRRICRWRWLWLTR